MQVAVKCHSTAIREYCKYACVHISTLAYFPLPDVLREKEEKCIIKSGSANLNPEITPDWTANHKRSLQLDIGPSF